MTLSEAYNSVLEIMPGYTVISAAETDSDWLFSFGSEDGNPLDESPVLVSKKDGDIRQLNIGDDFMDIIFAKPITLPDNLSPSE